MTRRLRHVCIALVSGTVLFGFTSPDNESQDAGLRQIPITDITASARCGEQALAWLRARAAAEIATSAAPLAGSHAASYRVRTSRRGAWLTLTATESGEIEASRVEADGVERVRWGSSCAPISRSETGPFSPDTIARGLTDEALEAAIGDGRPGVFYLWSPHMRFSVEAFGAITAAADARDLDLIPVLDPASDISFARTAAESAGLPPAALRPVASVELLFRGFTGHAPSVQLFGRGKLVGPVLPGARAVEGYLEFIDSFAQELSR